MKQLSSKKYNTKLKASIQRTGRLCFTQELASKMSLTDQCSIGFAEDEENGDLYLVVKQTIDNEWYELNKSSRYLYAHTALFFDEMGLDYTHNNLVFEFIPATEHDGIEGEVYKIKIKTKDGEILHTTSSQSKPRNNIKQTAAKQRVVIKLWNFIDKAIRKNKSKWCVLEDYPLTDEINGLCPDLNIYNEDNQPIAFILVTDNKEEAAATKKIEAALRTHELIEAFLYNYESNVWKSNIKKAKSSSISHYLETDLSKAFDYDTLAASLL